MDKNYPYPTGISEITTPARSQIFNWSCSVANAALCEYRFTINQTATHTFDAEPYGTATTASQLTGDGVYYLHIQVRHTEIQDYVSNVISYRFILDNTPPTLTSFTLPANALYNLNMDMDFRLNYSENVVVTGSPRLVIRVGSTTRYANYQSGSGTPNLIFRYDTQTGDLDNDGITFLSTSVDLNGGTITDLVQFVAPVNFTGMFGSTAGLLVNATDSTPPTPSLWTWAMSSPASGSTSNDTTPLITLSGAGAENGATVQVYDNATCTNAKGIVRTISAGTATFSDVSYLTNGSQDGNKVYYVIATDTVGNASTCTSIGLNYFLDTVNPNSPGAPTNLTNWVLTTASSALFSWNTPTDAGANPSGINHIEVALASSAAGGNNVADWAWLTPSTLFYTYTGLSLTQCVDIYPSIRSVDNAGNTSSIVVTTPFRSDASAPTTPVFSIGTNQTLAQTPTMTISTASTDNCSFAGYDFALSRDTNNNGTLDVGEIGNTVAWTSIGTVTTYQRTGLSLLGGVGYFVSLRGRDTAGNLSTAVHSSRWFGQYCEGVTSGFAYSTYNKGTALNALSQTFVKATQPGWADIDYTAIGSVATIVSATTTAIRPVGDYYGLMFSGYLEIKTSETYTFYTASDDGSDVFIGNTRVVNNDFLQGTTERNGTIALTPGCYPIHVRYYENTGGDEITVSYSSPTITKAAIPGATRVVPRYAPIPQIDWTLDTGSGATATDASPHGFNGTISNSPTWISTPRCAISANARALTLNGSNQYITSPALTGVDVLQTDLAVSFWARFTSSTAGMRFIDLGGDGLQIITGTGGTIGFDANGGVGTATYSAASFNDGNWHNVFAIRRGTNLKLFIDGTQRISMTVNSAATTFANVTVGRRNTGAGFNYYAGDIDQVKVWNQALDNSNASLSASELFNFPCR